MVEVSKSLLHFGCSGRCSELGRLALCTVASISGVASGRGSSVRRGCGGGDLCASLGVSCVVLVDSGGDTSVGGGVGNSVSSTSWDSLVPLCHRGPGSTKISFLPLVWGGTCAWVLLCLGELHWLLPCWAVVLGLRLLFVPVLLGRLCCLLCF